MHPQLSHRLRLGAPRRGRPAGALACALWLGRWLLVLLLVCDQVGSPLHRHHHDSGVDGSWLTAPHGAAAADLLHLEDADAGIALAHAVTAMRQQAKSDPLVAIAAARTAPSFALIDLVAWALAVEPVPRPDARPPDFTSHRSLPPAGRAPPLHA